MRYKVIDKSVSGHCCFEATVMDTYDTQDMPDGSIVCECFEKADAEKVAAALEVSDVE